MTRLVFVVVILAAGCATVDRFQDGRPRLVVPAACPDGRPVRFLQHAACGRDCGYSCLPDRWATP